MKKKLLIRKAHRYIGLFISLQLLAWTIGGIWFAWNDIDTIHGDHLRTIEKSKNSEYLAKLKNLFSTQIAINKISNFKLLQNIKVINILNKPVYQIKYTNTDHESTVTLIDATNGNFIKINKQQALEIAKSNISFTSEIESVVRINKTDKHHEYRNKPLPAWAITFDYPGSPTVYVSTQLGTFTSIRHTSWRVFDFLWMLHTMDYQGRDDFGNWLIKIFSVIALVTALSGIILFFISSRKKRI